MRRCYELDPKGGGGGAEKGELEKKGVRGEAVCVGRREGKEGARKIRKGYGRVVCELCVGLAHVGRV